jgi:hypothetical protein
MQARGEAAGNGDNLTRRQTNLFPFINMGYDISNKFGVSGTLNSSIQRPSYESLNPFLVVHDPYTTESGSPLLASGRTYNVTGKLNYRKHPILELGIRNTHDYIVQLPIQQSNDRIAGNYVNLDLWRQYRVAAYYPIRFGNKVNGYGGVTSYWSHYVDNKLALDLSRHSVTAFAQTQYQISQRYSLTTNAWLTTGGIEGPVLLDRIGGLGMTLGYVPPMKSKWPITASLGCNDVLNMTSQGEIIATTYPIRVSNRNCGARYFCNLRYDIGQDLQKRHQRESSSQADKNRVNWNQ